MLSTTRYAKHLTAGKMLADGDKARAAGRTDAAMKSLRAALVLAPHATRLHLKLGFWLVGAQRHEEALTHLRKAALHHPKLRDSHYGLGVVLANLGRHAEAWSSLEKALTLDPPLTDPFQATVLGAAAAVLRQWEGKGGAPEGKAQQAAKQYSEAAAKTAELVKNVKS